MTPREPSEAEKDTTLRAVHALYEGLLAMSVPPQTVETALIGYARHRANTRRAAYAVDQGSTE